MISTISVKILLRRLAKYNGSISTVKCQTIYYPSYMKSNHLNHEMKYTITMKMILSLLKPLAIAKSNSRCMKNKIGLFNCVVTAIFRGKSPCFTRIFSQQNKSDALTLSLCKYTAANSLIA